MLRLRFGRQALGQRRQLHALLETMNQVAQQSPLRRLGQRLVAPGLRQLHQILNHPFDPMNRVLVLDLFDSPQVGVRRQLLLVLSQHLLEPLEPRCLHRIPGLDAEGVAQRVVERLVIRPQLLDRQIEKLGDLLETRLFLL